MAPVASCVHAVAKSGSRHWCRPYISLALWAVLALACLTNSLNAQDTHGVDSHGAPGIEQASPGEAVGQGTGQEATTDSGDRHETGNGHAGGHGDMHAQDGGDHAEAGGHDEGDHGEEGHALHLDGSQLSVLWGIPFIGILLSIAVFPLIAPHIWHKRFGLIALFWAAAFVVPFAFSFGPELALAELLHVIMLEYVPFIILVGTLFIVTGGIRLRGTLVGTPALNTGLLGLGTVLASLMGTTGAAMLLIRIVLRANEMRIYRVHVVVFFIFLVANIGGSLTPLGDPPLFLGFLQGVDFFWVTTNMLLPMLAMVIPLLFFFFFLDTVLHRREAALRVERSENGHLHRLPHEDSASEDIDWDGDNAEPEKEEKLGVEGKINLLFLLGVVGAVLLEGFWKPHIEISYLGYAAQDLQFLIGECLMALMAVMSLVFTNQTTRRRNGFSWFPIEEVGKLFAAIFVTIVPVIAMLKAGVDGPLGGIIALVSVDGEPINAMYFVLTGVLSSFLDNAPTYLVFFNTAGGNAEVLMTDLQTTLVAISAGAVFMGANSYIGNAPNFMVKSIAEEYGVRMPSFFAFLAWSVAILGPLYVLQLLLFFL